MRGNSALAAASAILLHMLRMFAALALALALHGATVASLDADPAFIEGTRLYQALEYEQAVFRFEELALRAGVAPADKATALVWLGLSWAGTGDLEAARRCFGDALRTDVDVRLPPNQSPRVVALFREVSDQAHAARAATADAAQQPMTSTSRTTGTSSGGDGNPMLANVLVASGAAALAASVVLGAVASVTWQSANAPDAYQSDVVAALDAMRVELIGAAVLAPIGLVVGGIGGVLWGDADDASAGPATTTAAPVTASAAR